MQYPYLLKKLYYALRTKHKAELSYWQKCYHNEAESFSNGHYQRLLLAMAREPNQDFLRNKVVADFGCGPRGSLAWITDAKALYGIDVLVPEYLKSFHKCMKTHPMIYVSSTEEHIPMPTESVDVIFSLNALDHVKDFAQICSELRRILKSGGELIGSFNLNGQPTAAEPQKLTREKIQRYLLKDYQIKHCIVSAPATEAYMYQPLIEGNPIPVSDSPAIMWVRAQKP